MIFRFGSFRLDTRLFELRRDDTPVPIEPQVFDLLRLLIENRDEIVSKDEIIDTVWNGRIVSEATLSSRMNAARRAVGDDGNRQDVIRTLPRRGFRFVQPVEVEDNGAASGHVSENDAPLEIADPEMHQQVRFSDKPSIAVLPFDNMSGDPEQEYFSDGITGDIITALSRFRWFFVIARNSSFAYKGRNVDVRKVGRELGVRYVLEGSVRRGGNRLRITAQLVEAATGNHLWAEMYDGALEDVFDLQDRITEGVAGAIEPTLRQAEVERARRTRPDNLDAYDQFLRALQHAWNYTQAETEKAIEFLETALRIDPGYAAAHGLAAWFNGCLATIVLGHPQGSDFVQHARSVSVQHARAVLGPDTDDSLALAFAAWALALFEHDYDAALDAVNRALALTPNSSTVLSLAAIVEAYAGRFDDAITHAEASLRLSPFDPMRYVAEVAAAFGHFFTERYDEAAEAAQRSAHINPRFVSAIALLVASRTRSGNTQAAQAAAERLFSLSPDFHVGDFIRMGRFAPEMNENFSSALREAGLPE